MAFTPEIKNFAKNTVIFTVIFALVIHFSWEYVASFLGFSARAHNEATFENANITYIGNTATALSLRAGGVEPPQTSNAIGGQAIETISIPEVLGSPGIGQEKLIASNMLAITAYAGVLKTNIIDMLETSYDRSKALDNHISLLKSYYLKTNDRLAIIRDQKNDLTALLSKSNADQTTAKNTLQSSYNSLEYAGVDRAITDFLTAKSLASRAKIYMIYLERFEKSYHALQNKNKKILDAIINNRNGIIQKSVVVIPDTGTDIVKELGLIQSEADYKAQQALQ